MAIAQINGINLYYEVHGEGTPVVCVAGFSADHQAWREITPALAEQYQVIVFDNRGAGQTDVPSGPYCIEDFAKDTVALCDHLDIDKAHFIGNSMGGMILQQLGYSYPERVRSLCIANSVYKRSSVFTPFLEAHFDLVASGADIHALVRQFMCWLVAYDFINQPGKLDEMVEFALNNPHPFTLEGYQNQLHALKQFDATNWISQIACPTLVMAGDQDIIFRSDTVKAIADAISGSIYLQFKHCGHLPMLEKPAAFVNAVNNFYQQLA